MNNPERTKRGNEEIFLIMMGGTWCISMTNLATNEVDPGLTMQEIKKLVLKLSALIEMGGHRGVTEN